MRTLEQNDSLSEGDRRAMLAAIGRNRQVEAGEDIVREGDQPWESTLLLEGFAARYAIDASGNRQITALHIPGDFVDLHSFLLARMDHGVVAITRCELSGVPHDALNKLTEENPSLTRRLWLSTVIDGAVHRQWLAQMGGADAYHRTAHLICELFMRLQAVDRVKDYAFDLPLTQSDFGDMLGMSNVHMNRTLMQLRNDGLVDWQNGQVKIRDWASLKDLAGFDPTYLNLPSSA